MAHKRQAWVVMLAAFVAGVAVTANQFKVPPALPALLPTLGLDMAAGGWLMSVFSVAAIGLSIPTAVTMSRLGLKRAGLAALGCVIAGSLVGALASSAVTLLVGRVIEGVGMSVVAVASPALISLWFEPRDRGLPMGIWAAWVPVGSVIAFNTAPLIERAFGWRAIWWAGALFAGAALILFALLAREPGRAAAAPPHVPPREALRALLNPASWLLALTFGAFAFGQLGYTTWAPSYLTTRLSIAPATASFYTSLLFLAGIAANVSAGWAMNRIAHRAALPAAAMLATAVLLWWGFDLPGAGAAVLYMLALGLVSNAIPTAVFTLAPDTVKRPESIGLAVAAVNVVSNVGVLLGPPVVGALVAGGQWRAGTLVLVAVSVVGFFAALLAWRALQPAPREVA
jgi:MFS family permease